MSLNDPFCFQNMMPLNAKFSGRLGVQRKGGPVEARRAGTNWNDWLCSRLLVDDLNFSDDIVVEVF
jgi:hypothetical protein